MRPHPTVAPPKSPPGAADPTEVIEGAGHFDGLTFDGITDEMAPAPPPADVVAKKPTPAAATNARTGRRVAAIAGYTVLGLVSLLVLGLTGYSWGQLNTLDTGIHKSDALISPTEKKSLNGDTNILIMGLDSRLDENGKPLPQNIYDALHAGDDSVGGFNANVLMLLHVPVHGQAVEISIPRDDYVNLPGCPDGTCKEKIKQAYGLARDQAYNKLRGQGVTGATLEQEARDAGRKEEADTVSQFLGGIPIDHFVEVTLVAFFQIAQVVQPVTVCVAKTTHDTYSGANFKAGTQRLSASQALAFVRQRRDNVKGDFYYHNFTDLDRERRQQAFISSLSYKLRQAGTFTSPTKISAILNVAKQNTAIDSGLNLLDFAQEASNLTGGHVTFNTLPVERYADFGGSIGDVNIVNVPIIQAQVRTLLGIKPPSATDAPAP
ncbi:MAG TPA: LCP family protein, partial [Pseudonocardiaceae bacterium]|nr:LCP family protein [Pseudonocardiaceae bacterium]